ESNAVTVETVVIGLLDGTPSTLGGTADVTVTQMLDWRAGTIESPLTEPLPTLFVAAGATFTSRGLAATRLIHRLLDNAGTATFSGANSVGFSYSATLRNSGTLTVENLLDPLEGFENSGTLAITSTGSLRIR